MRLSLFHVFASIVEPVPRTIFCDVLIFKFYFACSWSIFGQSVSEFLKYFLFSVREAVQSFVQSSRWCSLEQVLFRQHFQISILKDLFRHCFIFLIFHFKTFYLHLSHFFNSMVLILLHEIFRFDNIFRQSVLFESPPTIVPPRFKLCNFIPFAIQFSIFQINPFVNFCYFVFPQHPKPNPKVPLSSAALNLSPHSPLPTHITSHTKL